MTATPRPGMRDVAALRLAAAGRDRSPEHERVPVAAPAGVRRRARATRSRRSRSNRYPDGQMTRLREELAASRRSPVRRHLGRQRLERDPARSSCRRTAAPVAARVVFEPTYLLHSRIAWLTQTGRGVARRWTMTSRSRQDADRGRDRRDARRGVRLLAEQPDRERAAGGRGGVARRAGPTRSSSSTRRTSSSAGTTLSPAHRRAPERRRHAHDVEGVRAGRRADRLRARVAGRGRRPAARPPAVPPVGHHAGRRHRRAPSREGGDGDPGRDPRRARPDPRSLFARCRTSPSIPSDANFVLFVPPKPAAEVWQGLVDRGVLIRDLSSVVPNALRVTAGTTTEVDLFLSALEEVLAA